MVTESHYIQARRFDRKEVDWNNACAQVPCEGKDLSPVLSAYNTILTNFNELVVEFLKTTTPPTDTVGLSALISDQLDKGLVLQDGEPASAQELLLESPFTIALILSDVIDKFYGGDYAQFTALFPQPPQDIEAPPEE